MEHPGDIARRIGAVGALWILVACGGSGGGDRATPWAQVPDSPAYLAYRADEEAGLPVSEVLPLQYTAAEVAKASGALVLPPPATAPGLCSFPAHYDLRALGRVTPPTSPAVPCGSCWTSAAMGSLESFLAVAELHDFSEAHLQLMFGPDDATCGQGGNAQTAIPYFAAWRGPVDEADFNPALAGSGTGGTGPPVRAHVQNVYLLPSRTGPLDNCWIKLAVTNLGGVYSSISRTEFSPNWTVNHAYYHPSKDTIHAVTIVGWDDDFDRNLFYCGDPQVPADQQVPAGNGAFLVKDNAGPDWMDGGYFWVSYYDGSIGTGLAAFTAEATGNYHRKYELDPFGPVTELTTLPGQLPEYSWQAAVFTAQEEEWLEAVSFYNLIDPAMDYQVRVYLDPTDGPVGPGAPSATFDVPLMVTGYFTARLPQKVHLGAGQRFGIVLRGHDRTGGWPPNFTVEEPTPAYTKVKAGPGQTFVSVDGVSWQDLTTVVLPLPGGKKRSLAGANLCIKAFTRRPLTASAALDLDHAAIAWQFGNEGGEDEWVKPAARLLEKDRDAFVDLGVEVGAVSYAVDGGRRDATFDGWVLVPPGAAVTAYSADGALGGATRVSYSWWQFAHDSGAVLIADFWKYLDFLVSDPLHVVSTNPPAGGHVDAPGLSMITVAFDVPVKPGPSLQYVTVMSASEVKTVFCAVDGNELHVFPSTPLSSKELGGTQWSVHLPSDAVLSSALSNPLAQPLDWAFTVAGVN